VAADYSKHKAKIETLGATQVIVTNECGAGSIGLARYREITGFQGVLIVDTDQNIYHGLGCKKKGEVLKGLGSSVFGKSSKFLSTATLDGNIDQQGGQFVITSDGSLVYSYRESHAGEFRDYDGIFKALESLQK